MSIVPNVLCSPAGTLPYAVTVKNSSGQALEGIDVTLTFTEEADDLMCWCVGGQAHPVITETTDGNGNAVFYIYAGGCLDPDSLSTPPVTVTADEVTLADVGVVSTDPVDEYQILPWNGWDPGNRCEVGLSDMAWFTPYFSVGAFHFCADFDSDEDVDMDDLNIATPDLRLGPACNTNPN
jgi:hypothetical protein